MKDITEIPESFQNGRYKVLKLLGEGGKGIVYKCIDNNLNRIVAIKLIKGDVLERDSYQRILREAETTAKMSHHNIVSIYDMQRENSRFYMVMEYIDGENLFQYVNRNGKALPVSEVLRISIAIANALDYAHKRGVFHRDIKPENVMMTKDGTPKLMDFGLAKAIDAPNLTHAGTIVGTPEYISPESALGREVDERSDLYSLGCVMYFMSTGSPPFSASDSIKLIYSHIHDNPLPPSSVNSHVPKQMDIVIMKLLRKNPQERFQNAEKLIDSLMELQNTLISTPGSENSERQPVGKMQPAHYSFSETRSSSLLGIEDELSAIRSSIDSVHLGEGKAIVITGEAGQGKTRILEEAMDYAMLRGLKVITVRGRENRKSTPNYMFTEMFREFFYDAPQQLVYKVCGNYGDVAVKILPELGAKVGKVNDLFSQDPGEAALRFQDGVAEIVRNMTNEMPLLLEFDDINNGDQGSLELINILLDGIDGMNALVLVTTALNEEEDNPSIEKIFGNRKVLSIRLHNLDRDETAELIARRLGEDRKKVSDEFSNFIYSRTNGNPLYVEEVMKLLMEKRMIFRKESGSWDRKPLEEIGIPSSVKGFIRERLSNIDDESKEILSTAAVIGQEFDIDVLEKLIEPADSNRFNEKVEGLIKRKMLLERKTRPGQFRLYFANPQVHSYFFDSVSMLRKRRLHSRISEIMISLYGDDNQEIFPDLAYHYLEAGDYENALKYGIKLADLWASSFQFERAVQQYRATIEIMQSMPNFLKTMEGRKALATSLYKASYYGIFSGNYDFESLEKAAKIFEEAGDLEMVAYCLFLLLNRSRRNLRSEYWLDYSLDFLNKNMRSPQLRSVVTRLGFNIAANFWWESKFDREREVNEMVLSYAVENGIDDLFTKALQIHSANLIQLRNSNDIEKVFNTYQEMEKSVISNLSRDPMNEMFVNVAASFYDAYANQYVFLKHNLAKADEIFQRGSNQNQELCSSTNRRIIPVEKAFMILLPRGEWDEIILSLADETPRNVIDDHINLMTELTNAIMDAYRGKWDSVFSTFDKADEISSAQYLSYSPSYRAIILVEQNRIKEASEYVEKILAKIKGLIINAEIFSGYVEMLYYGSLINIILDNREKAEGYLKSLEEVSSRFNEDWITNYLKASKSRFEEKFGELKEAIELMREARDAFSRSGYKLLAAQLSYELARMYHKNEEWEKSSAAIEDALSIFDKLNCTPFVEKCLRLKEMLNA